MEDDSLTAFAVDTLEQMPETWRCTLPSGRHSFGVTRASQPKLRVWDKPEQTAVRGIDTAMSLVRVTECICCSRKLTFEALVPCLQLRPGEMLAPGYHAVQVTRELFISVSTAEVHLAEERLATYVDRLRRAHA